MIEEGRGFDAFGKPRKGDRSDKAPAILGSRITERGFTAHEHLDDHQLIHMNGRGYDYGPGRFPSVDPIIQAPGNSQSLNRYSFGSVLGFSAFRIISLINRVSGHTVSM